MRALRYERRKYSEDCSEHGARIVVAYTYVYISQNFIYRRFLERNLVHILIFVAVGFERLIVFVATGIPAVLFYGQTTISRVKRHTA